MTRPVTHNALDSRFELHRDGELISFARYVTDGDVISVTHVETAPGHRDQGNSDRLMAGLLDHVRAGHGRVRPVCWVAVEYLRLHPDQRDLEA